MQTEILIPSHNYKILKMTFKKIHKNPDEVTAWLVVSG